jgi:hypothetical protein
MTGSEITELSTKSLARILNGVFPPENNALVSEDYDTLLGDLREIGIVTISQLHLALNAARVEAALAEENRQIRRRKADFGYIERVNAINPTWLREGVHFTHVGLARIALGIGKANIVGRLDDPGSQMED